MLIRLFPSFISQINKQSERLDQARMRVLSTLLLTYVIAFSFLNFVYLTQWQSFLFLRVCFLTIVLLITLISLIEGYGWRLQAHIFICCLTLIIWTNVLFVRGGVNFALVQYVAIILACGFYLLEERWGFFYACTSIAPLLVYIFTKAYTNISLDTLFQIANQKVYHLVLCLNFANLTYVHYNFSKGYKKVHHDEYTQRQHLQKALRLAEDTAQERTNFLATMSHELRTPLNAVIGMTNLLLMEKHLETQKENLGVLQFSADNLMTIINDILDFSKIDAGRAKVNPVAFRIDVLIKHICVTFKSKAEAKGVKFEYSFSDNLQQTTLMGDQTRITQIFFNLLSNAVKFTSNGSIEVHAETMGNQDANNRVGFTVSDTGIGIPYEQLVSIFEPYQQSQARTNRQHHGTGLGLTIAKRLVELLGGELAMTSKEGAGTTFYFDLPLPFVAREENQSTAVASEKRDLAELKILVAEDNPVNILVIRKTLRKWSIEPTIVENGQLALEAVQKENFDVVLMDINMPVMDGFEASRHIRELADQRKAMIPIIALTASIGASIEHHHGYQFISDCMLKPFKPEDLRKKLETLSLYW